MTSTSPAMLRMYFGGTCLDWVKRLSPRLARALPLGPSEGVRMISSASESSVSYADASMLPMEERGAADAVEKRSLGVLGLAAAGR